MDNETSNEIRRIDPPGLFDGRAFGMSQGSIDEASGLIFLSGQVSWDENGQVRGKGYGEQTRLALQNARIALEAAGSDAQHVLRARIYVRGEVSDHIAEVVAAVIDFFGETRPAMTGVGVASLATPDTLVEIELVARTSAP